MQGKQSSLCFPYFSTNASNSDDGRIILHDQRSWSRPSRAHDTIALDCPVTDVKWHPTLEHIFATSEEKGAVCLRDTRMAFGPATRRTREGVVQTVRFLIFVTSRNSLVSKYNTKISKGSVRHLSNPEPSSLTFDSDGQ